MAEKSAEQRYWQEVRVNGAAAAVLLLHCVLANAAAWNKCGMFDEPSHIAGGFAAHRTGDYRILPLAICQQLWMTWPLEWSAARAPATDTPSWYRSDNWTYGRELLYEVGNDPQSVLHTCRFMNSLGSVMLGAIVFAWSRRLFGTAGGFTSLVLYAFNPTVLGHAAAATPDTFAALAFAAASLSLWAVLRRVTLARLLGSGIVWGLALTAKFSTLLLLPIAAMMLAVRLASAEPLAVGLPPKAAGGRMFEVVGRIRRLPYFAFIAAVHAVVAWGVIWALFDFRFDTFREFPNDPKQIYLGSFDEIAGQTGRMEPLIRTAHAHRLLPEAYLYCFAETVRTTGGRVCYLDGVFATQGFVSFFPLAFLYKTPPAFFAVAGAAIAAHIARRRKQLRAGRRAAVLLCEGFYATYPLWCVLLVYGYTSITGPLNIGIRHILPMFAPLFVLCGAAGAWLAAVARKRTIADEFGRFVVGAGLALYSVDTLASFPNYVAYFNWPSGGTSGGHRHLVDSSLDWGQELPALKSWLESQGIEVGKPGVPQTYLSYFGTTPPTSVGLRTPLLPCYFRRELLDPTAPKAVVSRLSEGIFCISATMLQAVYVDEFEGPWCVSYEHRYRELLSHVDELDRKANDEAGLKELLSKPNPQWWKSTIERFEQARLARLCAYLRKRKPVHVVNGAILVYRLSASDIEQALRYELPTVPDPARFGDPTAY